MRCQRTGRGRREVTAAAGEPAVVFVDVDIVGIAVVVAGAALGVAAAVAAEARGRSRTAGGRLVDKDEADATMTAADRVA